MFKCFFSSTIILSIGYSIRILTFWTILRFIINKSDLMFDIYLSWNRRKRSSDAGTRGPSWRRHHHDLRRNFFVNWFSNRVLVDFIQTRNAQRLRDVAERTIEERRERASLTVRGEWVWAARLFVPRRFGGIRFQSSAGRNDGAGVKDANGVVVVSCRRS